MRVFGFTLDGNEVDEVNYINENGVGLKLFSGEYEVQLAGSPINSEGAIYVVPGNSISVSVDKIGVVNVSQDKPWELYEEPVEETTREDIEQAYQFVITDPEREKVADQLLNKALLRIGINLNEERDAEAKAEFEAAQNANSNSNNNTNTNTQTSRPTNYNYNYDYDYSYDDDRASPTTPMVAAPMMVAPRAAPTPAPALTPVVAATMAVATQVPPTPAVAATTRVATPVAVATTVAAAATTVVAAIPVVVTRAVAATTAVAEMPVAATRVAPKAAASKPTPLHIRSFGRGSVRGLSS